MIQLEGLTKSFRMAEGEMTILHGIDLTIAAGEMVAIMGPSGSGKSTLMNILGCLDAPSSGRYMLEGTDVTKLSKSKLAKTRGQRIGFVFQSFNLIPRTDAMRNVELPLVYNGVRSRRAKAKAALERVGLGSRLRHVPSELSGGQKQRVAIARALINDPSIILADEPTGALDTKSTVEIMELFTELNAAGCTIVVITHEDEVAEYCTRRVWLRDGLIRSDDKVQNRRTKLTTVGA
ncbi:MAG TPA: ABC transporter ATP-binding protein [Jatrophihabitans sp.]|jgi:putative ABC transport system ATP-binding protein|uniref:ABC transporter ATP-binding protein n=1 Tax=Pseudonocardia sp. Cha107L01 TaxID=3457576 RepID=UPI0028C613FC|nr:putative transport system ATP-binding protein [Pseudonocardiales bacterium]MDT7664913.1 putative transport system ATP-binding protein [Pseudonocardiales bacterium]MDT7682140.1 putative transport system ATP-binding protein [Pseudonocardiales bacterium]MDT7695941.1 putative transport system ATP-binding protein [Pseudonocardiales bacterium]